jgi:hypothetical protein
LNDKTGRKTVPKIVPSGGLDGFVSIAGTSSQALTAVKPRPQGYPLDDFHTPSEEIAKVVN